MRFTIYKSRNYLDLPSPLLFNLSVLGVLNALSVSATIFELSDILFSVYPTKIFFLIKTAITDIWNKLYSFSKTNSSFSVKAASYELSNVVEVFSDTIESVVVFSLEINKIKSKFSLNRIFERKNLEMQGQIKI